MKAKDITARPQLELLAASEEAGVCAVSAHQGRQIFITGHLEYDTDTLAAEYRRDVAKGLDIAVPRHYFPGDDPQAKPAATWRAHAHLLFTNWLNYYVYQATPYNLDELEEIGRGNPAADKQSTSQGGIR